MPKQLKTATHAKMSTFTARAFSNLTFKFSTFDPYFSESDILETDIFFIHVIADLNFLAPKVSYGKKLNPLERLK